MERVCAASRLASRRTGVTRPSTGVTSRGGRISSGGEGSSSTRLRGTNLRVSSDAKHGQTDLLRRAAVHYCYSHERLPTMDFLRNWSHGFSQALM